MKQQVFEDTVHERLKNKIKYDAKVFFGIVIIAHVAPALTVIPQHAEESDNTTNQTPQPNDGPPPPRKAKGPLIHKPPRDGP